MNINFTPAFPTWVNDDSMMPGMTLRDYFAATALPAIMKDWYAKEFMCGDDDCKNAIAIISYAIADAMMEARK